MKFCHFFFYKFCFNIFFSFFLLFLLIMSVVVILFKTNSFEIHESWDETFNAISPETIKYLKQKDVILIGIDTPSVDKSDSKDLLGHQEFYKNNIRVLEGITLSEVPEGVYELIALPLKLEGLDASPVRAILRR